MKKNNWILLLACCLATVPLTAQHPFQVRKEGAGPQAIIWIPGFASSGDVWNETLPAYKEYTSYILTMPGFAGASPESAPSIEQWVTEIAAFIKEEQLKKPIVIGHSMGGGMALLLASRYPGLLSKIVVVDALPCLSALGNERFHSVPHPDCSMMAAQFTRPNDSGFYRMQKSAIRMLMQDTAHAAEVVQWSMRSDRKTLGAMFCQYSNLDMRDSLGVITCPALILLESPFVTYRSAIEEQFRQLHTGTLVYATKALHFIMFDDRDWYLGQLAVFLKK